MGIRNLNRFLKENAGSAIRLKGLSELSGKSIVVDTSIYMYRFASEGTLIENMYLMLATFRYYNIIPVFVFDGKPPIEKMDLLKKRKEDKQEAEREYNELQKQLTDGSVVDDMERQEILCNMDTLKKSFVCINKNDIERVKDLIRAYGATYYDAPGEADELCAMLTIKGKVWACLSEDMDMFVYGCPRVIRYLSLLNHKAVIYDMNGILNCLGITQNELREICVISGTDYNCNENDRNGLFATLKYFKKYCKSSERTNGVNFYEWLYTTYKNYITDYDTLKNIYSMFDLKDNMFEYENMRIMNGPIQKDEINAILKADGFLFP